MLFMYLAIIGYNTVMPLACGLGWLKPEYGVSVNHILTKGADYAHRITACPLVFENLTTSLQYNM